MKNFALNLTLLLAVLIFFNSNLIAQVLSSQMTASQGAQIEEKLGDYIPLDAKFATVSGDSVSLGDLLEEGKPIILNPLYFDCPVLCGLVIDGMIDVIDDLAWQPGKDFNIISFSIDTTENHEVAAKYKEEYLSKINSKQIESGWYFLTGKKSQIDNVIESVGFNYFQIEGTTEFAHSAAIIILSPEGKITRYLYGIKYDEFNVRNALFEAVEGKIGSTLEKIIMYCYQYDPNSNSYVPLAMNIMKIGGLATLIFLGIFMSLLWVRDKNKKQTSNLDIS